MKKLEKFIKNSLISKTSKEVFEIDILSSTFEKIEKLLGLNLKSYKFIIKEEYIRHVKNRHPQDIDLLLQLPNILNNFSKLKKSIIPNPQTKKPEINLVFTKMIGKNKVEMVAIRIYKKKILSLKTVYRKDL